MVHTQEPLEQQSYQDENLSASNYSKNIKIWDLDNHQDFSIEEDNLEFVYTQAGQENSFLWDNMKDGYLFQGDMVMSKAELEAIENGQDVDKAVGTNHYGMMK